jgi:hypothetical protein
MPAQLATMTSARAIIKSNGVAIGYMKNLRCTETKQRADVKGIGRVYKLERPIVGGTCTWSCDFAVVDLKKTGIPNLDNKTVQSITQYENTQVLLENTVDIYVYKKDIQTIVGGIVTAVNETVFAILRDVYLDSSNWDISENQVSSMSQSGEYLNPVILPV